MTGRLELGAEAIAGAVVRLGRELSDTYDDGVVLVAVLKASVVFLADLVRTMSIDPVVEFLGLSAYADGAGRARIVMDLESDIGGRDVVIVEAVVDTGLTLSFLLRELKWRGPRSLKVCALVDKVSRRVVPVPVRWTGFAVDAPYVVGYGLDHAERYRNVGTIVEADPMALADDPDALLPHLYTGG